MWFLKKKKRKWFSVHRGTNNVTTISAKSKKEAAKKLGVNIKSVFEDITLKTK